MTDQVRNLSQTYQEREIVKTAPDLVVYINNLPYIINPYLGSNGTVVNFNDFVVDAAGACDVDNMIPTSSVTLSVPNHYASLFQAPGGNKILSTMSTIKIFAKGYYFDEDGNTVYHRVFFGIIDSIGYNTSGTTLQITLSCKGIMRLFELIQTNLAPSTLNFSVMYGSSVTAFQSKDYDKNPLAIIAKNIYSELKPEEIVSALNETSIATARVIDSRTKQQQLISSVKNRFVDKWNIVLKEVQNATRIFGILKGDKIPSDPVDQAKFFDFQKTNVANYQPDYSIGSIQLMQSRITSKLERIATMASIVSYESYQDLNGDIIFKPPLYNLDVNNYSDKDPSFMKNPFIIKLSEITDEAEQEDEAAVRATRVTIKGQPWGAILNDFPGEIIPGVASYTDINLFSKFGMRDEPTKEIPWLKGDARINFAYAVAEMSRMNRAYRTYRFSIPMRPEMKLGFPCYIQHLDMYGYTRNISWSYSVGGRAIMSLTLDSLRRRSMMPIEVITTPKDQPNTKIKTYEFRSLGNLVWKFTKKDKTKPRAQSSETEASATTNPIGDKGAVGPSSSQISADNDINLQDYEKGDKIFFDDYYNFRTVQVSAPKQDQAWTIEQDKDVFTKPRSCDAKYMEEIFNTQPYTDDKGYELWGPFPWGRWQTVLDALTLFTYSEDEKKEQEEDMLFLDDRAYAMVFISNGNPGVTAVRDTLADIQDSVGSTDMTKFTIKDPSLGMNPPANGVLESATISPENAKVGDTQQAVLDSGTNSAIDQVKKDLVRTQS